jgi:hypothetical protein
MGQLVPLHSGGVSLSDYMAGLYKLMIPVDP